MQLDPENLRERIEPLFRDNFEKYGELGAAVSVWQNGKPMVDLHGGFCDAHREKPWTNDTLVLIWSATKGLGSASLLHALQENKIDISQRVAEFWPEFAQGGKEKITLAQLLSHSAGLAALDRPVDVLDYPTVIEAIEMQPPNWEPGTGHGYHARTFGFLLDELVRRIAGKPLGEYWRENFAEPFGLDLWIGLPENENARVATMYAAKLGKQPQPKIHQSNASAARTSDFYVDVATPGTFAWKVFNSPRGLKP
jgi:CubicO group peptidase (beta-lactamase class C family)